MIIKIGERIRELRGKAEITQEKLAEYLGVTYQAVSRWESGICYPDIELLPALARYFGVSADILLGIDADEDAKRIEELLGESMSNFNKGLIDENIAICRSAVNQYPNNFEILNQLAFFLGIKGEAAESTSIFERILSDCPDDKLRFSAVQHLAYRYCDAGEREKAKEITKKLSWLSQGSLLSQILEGDELINHLYIEIMGTCDHLRRDIEILAYSEYKDRMSAESAEKRIIMYRKIIDVFGIIFENGDYGFYHCRLEDLYRQSAMDYITIKDTESALDCIEKAAEHAVAYDLIPEIYPHTSMLFSGYDYKRSSISKDYSCNNCRQLLNRCLSDTIYDPLRSTESFEAVTALLEKYASEAPQG